MDWDLEAPGGDLSETLPKSEIYITFKDDPTSSNDSKIQWVDENYQGFEIESPVPLAQERIPVCPPEFIPQIGKVFDTLDEGVDFYKRYAKRCGFVSRLGTTKTKHGEIKNRYVLCNKQGESSVKGNQRRPTFRQGCGAIIKFKRTVSGQYEVYEFVEPHNHALQTPNTMVHLTQSRELNAVHKKMIIDNSKNNYGAVRSFRMFKEYVRGYRNVGASEEDFKNFYRDVKRFIKASDAQMLIETLMRRKSVCPSFYFDFDCDEEGRLRRVFWADPIMMKNNYLFGDMISFDTTFEMNTYNMVFAPFTGIDNHKRCITFGAGLVAREDKESFVWLFECYVKAMGTYPRCVITDQDLGIKAGIEKVFGDKTVHRYCVWHIMKKLPAQVGLQICNDTPFLKEINACVWGEDVEPTDFEERWDEVVAKYKLEGNVWLKEKRDMRDSWVPAYFRDVFLSGLMATTSRSESENSFFQNFTNSNLTLVEFFMRFESAMDAQRWKQSKLIATSKNTKPRLKTPLDLELHGSEMYTPTVFYEFQEELEAACFRCCVESLSEEVISVNDRDRDKTYVVKFMRKEEELELKCSCKMFERLGILCRHILWVLKEKKFEKIPPTYLLNRWSKLAYNQPIFNAQGVLIEDCKSMDTDKNKIGELWSEMFSCVALVEQKPDVIDDLISVLHDFKLKCESDEGRSSTSPKKDKNAEIGMLIGTSIPTEIRILPPRQSKNKGSGTGGKRLLSTREKEEKKAKKAPRLCACCKQMVHHDIRNCPDNPNRKKK